MSDYLPPEILVEIFLRLPPKTLIRFRCVSKSWNLLISNPRFISSFTSKSNATSDKLMVRYYSMEKKMDIYSVYSNDETFNVGETLKIKYPNCSSRRSFYRIVGSYKGVLCLTVDETILLLNPSITRKVTLPPAPSLLLFNYYNAVILGFGFDVKNKDYKVVRISYDRDEEDYHYLVEIYMLSVGKWREIDVQVPSNFRLYDSPQAFVNGNVHWIVDKITGEDTCDYRIMVFSMTGEVFDEMQLPHALSNELRDYVQIAVFEEALAVFEHPWGHCLIWVMEEYGIPKSWQKKIVIDFSLNDYLARVLRFRKNGHVLVKLGNHGSLISYDPKTGTRKGFGINGRGDSFFIDDYVESLALLIEGEQVPSDNNTDNNDEFWYF